VAVSFIIAVIHKDLTRSSSRVGAHFLLLIRYFQSAQWLYLLLKFSHLQGYRIYRHRPWWRCARSSSVRARRAAQVPGGLGCLRRQE
jgi:hypothetical protein